MGEYPLTWAAFLCNEGVYNLLLDKGADPDAQDLCFKKLHPKVRNHGEGPY